MKAIKDCEWKVEIGRNPNEGYYWWRVKVNGNIGCIINYALLGSLDIQQKDTSKSYQSAKRNWERFAKINGIKKWRIE